MSILLIKVIGFPFKVLIVSLLLIFWIPIGVIILVISGEDIEETSKCFKSMKVEIINFLMFRPNTLLETGE